jgi:hypothetical protein
MVEDSWFFKIEERHRRAKFEVIVFVYSEEGGDAELLTRCQLWPGPRRVHTSPEAFISQRGTYQSLHLRG